MAFSLRMLARSRRLRALGMLAWLLFAFNALAFAPTGMAGGMHAPAMAAMGIDGSHSPEAHAHGVTTARTSCCGHHDDGRSGPSGVTCHCASVCSSALPSSLVIALATAIVHLGYGRLPQSRAPSVRIPPPLRPPLA